MFESEEEEGRLRQFDLKRKTHELVPKFKSIWLQKISVDAICWTLLKWKPTTYMQLSLVVWMYIIVVLNLFYLF